jgi:hypothetical protein
VSIQTLGERNSTTAQNNTSGGAESARAPRSVQWSSDPTAQRETADDLTVSKPSRTQTISSVHVVTVQAWELLNAAYIGANGAIALRSGLQKGVTKVSRSIGSTASLAPIVCMDEQQQEHRD